MRKKAPIQLPATTADETIARAVAQEVHPAGEAALRAATYLADERFLLVGAAAFWAGCRLFARDRGLRRRADHLALCALASALIPHGIKKIVDRERPDRKIPVPRRRRHGIPRSGRPYDSFPSGHAVHMGAFAAALSRDRSAGVRAAVWSTAAVLASTRIFLLAHYPTDVAAGLGLGAALEAALEPFSRPLE